MGRGFDHRNAATTLALSSQAVLTWRNSKAVDKTLLSESQCHRASRNISSEPVERRTGQGSNPLKTCGLLVLFLAGSLVARADDDTVTMPELIQGAQQWAQENLDTNVLNALPRVDDPAVQQFFRELQKRYQGDYVVDLAGLRQTAQTVLSLLESSDETQPYAAWLKAQMDYLEVADEIRLTIPPPELKPTSRLSRFPILRRKRNARLWVKKVSVGSLAGFGQRICAGAEADFHRAKSSAGTGLGGGSGIVL